MKNLIIILMTALMLFSCGLFKKKQVLSDEKITNYINAYVEIKKIGIDLTGNNGSLNINKGLKEFKDIEAVIKQSGFKNYEEFIKVNKTIGIAFSLIQSDEFINSMDENVKKFENMTEGKSEEFKDLYALLNDPNIPEEQKKEIRKNLDDSKKLVVKNKQEFEKQKKFADGVLIFAKNMINPEDLELVRKHKDEILKAYTGKQRTIENDESEN